MVKVAIIAVLWKITFRIWILMYGMNLAVSFLVFFHIFRKKIPKKNQNFFFFFSFFFSFFFQFFFTFYKNTIIEFTAKVREGET